MAKQAELQDRIRKFVEETVLNMREKASKVLDHFEKSIKGHKRITKASINAVVTMIDSYIDLDIIGDEDFIHRMVSFKTKHLVFLNDTVLKQKPDFAEFICAELKELVKQAEDQAAISCLTQAYKNKIDV